MVFVNMRRLYNTNVQLTELDEDADEVIKYICRMQSLFSSNLKSYNIVNSE